MKNTLIFINKFNLFVFAVPTSRRRSFSGPLVVDWIDYCLEENGNKHKTSKYACMQNEKFGLVVRRGQSFSLIIKFNRVYHIINDNISFVFTCEGKILIQFSNCIWLFFFVSLSLYFILFVVCQSCQKSYTH